MDSSLTVSTIKDIFRTIVEDLLVLICCSSETITVTDLGYQTKLNSTQLCPYIHHKIEDADHIVVWDSKFVFKNSRDEGILKIVDDNIYNVSTQVEYRLHNSEEKEQYDNDSTDIDDIVATENVRIDYDRKKKWSGKKSPNPFIILKPLNDKYVEYYKKKLKCSEHVQNSVNCSEEIAEIFSKTCNSNNDNTHNIVDRCNPLLKTFESIDSEILHDEDNTENESLPETQIFDENYQYYSKKDIPNSNADIVYEKSPVKNVENVFFSPKATQNSHSITKSKNDSSINQNIDHQLFEFNTLSQATSNHVDLISSPFYNCTQDLRDVLSSQESIPKDIKKLNSKKKLYDSSNSFIMPRAKKLKNKSKNSGDDFNSSFKNNEENTLYNTQQLIDILMSQNTINNESIVNNNDDVIPCSEEEDSSDSDICQNMVTPSISIPNKYSFCQLDLPDSQEIKKCVDKTEYITISNSTSENDSDRKSDDTSDPPITYKKKVYNKRKKIKLNKENKKDKKINNSLSMSLRVSGRNNSRNQRSYRIMLSTQVSSTKWKSVIKNLGGTVVDTDGDVLIVSCMRRTVKTLLALSRKIPIVTLDWLKKSLESCHFLDPMQFLFIDKTFEKKYNFNFKLMMKSEKKHFLSGWTVYLTPNIDFNLEDMKKLIHLNGGICIIGENSQKHHKEQVFTISCTSDISIVKNFPKPYVTIETILDGIIDQRLNLKSHILQIK